MSDTTNAWRYTIERKEQATLFILNLEEHSCRGFQSFRTAVLEGEGLQEQVIFVVNTATANGPGLGDGIVALAKSRGDSITSEEVYQLVCW